MSSEFENLKQWPGDMVGEKPAPMGHNQPPSPMDDALREFNAVIDKRVGFREKIGELVASAARATCTDDDTARHCTDLAGQIKDAAKIVEDARKNAKTPYLEACRAVDGASQSLTVQLGTAQNKVKVLLDNHLRAMRRKAEEEREKLEQMRRDEQKRLDEERARAEAEGRPDRGAQLPPARPEPAPPQVRGDYGGSLASARTVWKAEVTDYTLAFIAVENNENVRAAIDKAINQMVRSGVRKIEGVRVYEDQLVSIR